MSAEQLAALFRLQEATTNQITIMGNMMANLAASIQSQASRPQNTEMVVETLARAVETFQPDTTSTFSQWYDKHQAVFTTDGASLTDDIKTRLLLRKISQEAYDKYVNIILPLKPEQVNFNDTVTKLKDIFSESKSQFQKRYDCLNIEKSATEDFVTYGARVNRMCEEFLIASIKPDEFKALMFVIGLKSSTDSNTRNRILALLEDPTRAYNLTENLSMKQSESLASNKMRH